MQGNMIVSQERKKLIRGALVFFQFFSLFIKVYASSEKWKLFLASTFVILVHFFIFFSCEPFSKWPAMIFNNSHGNELSHWLCNKEPRKKNPSSEREKYIINWPRCPLATFSNQYKIEFAHGWGNQYYLPRSIWAFSCSLLLPRILV